MTPPAAQNFCFWPSEQELEYEHLAGGLKRALLADPAALDARRLAAIDGPGVRALLGWPHPLPLEEERARLLREVGAWLQEQCKLDGAQWAGCAALCAGVLRAAALLLFGPQSICAAFLHQPFCAPDITSTRLMVPLLLLPPRCCCARWARRCWICTEGWQPTWCGRRASQLSSWCDS
jgi:hypothetical protein